MSRVQKYGHRWTKIACELPGRTANAIKNRCHLKMRAQSPKPVGPIHPREAIPPGTVRPSEPLMPPHFDLPPWPIPAERLPEQPEAVPPPRRLVFPPIVSLPFVLGPHQPPAFFAPANAQPRPH
jgi:hypothetical protein